MDTKKPKAEDTLPREALDDDVFAKMIEGEFDKEPPTPSDDALKARVWAKLEARIASESPSLSRAEASTAPPRRARRNPFLPFLAGALGLAAATLLFVRLGPSSETSPSLDPSLLKGNAAADATGALALESDATGRAFSFSLEGGPQNEAYGAVFFSADGGEPKMVARGRLLADQRKAGSRVLIQETQEGQEETRVPQTFLVPGAVREGRFCFFTAPAFEGLNNLVTIGASVFDKQSQDLCRNVSFAR